MPFFMAHDASNANWPIGPWRRIMSKIGFAVLASAIMASTFPAVSWGQSANNACTCGNVISPPAVSNSQAYRRFSYEPAPIVQGNIVPGTTMVPMQQPYVQQSQVYSPSASTQGYRRFSYQPAKSSTLSSHATDQPWRYSKTDPRRYR